MRDAMRRNILICAFAFTPALADHGHGDEKAAAVQMEHKDHCGFPAAEGRVVSLDVAKRRVTIAHEAIDALGWPKAETEIVVEKSVDLSAFAAEDRVHFLTAPDKKRKGTEIAAMCAADAGAAAHEACMGAMHKTAMTRASAAGKECAGLSHDAHEGHGAKKKDEHSGHH
jgi:Cu/Ag efflux protein CusF